VGLTRSLAAEGARLGIKVNAISPYAHTVALRTMLTAEAGEQNEKAGLTPDVVAPIAVWLAHEDCTITGRVIEAAAGSFNEAFISQTAAAPPNPDLTPEDVAAAMDSVLDRTGATPYRDGGDFIYDMIKPYETTPRTE
jgi:NAD(P)-dependent dehydrogenase (short-subunit alcohol dehydrogenase family)